MKPEKISVDAVFERISQLFGCKSDADIGRFLGTSHQNVYQNRKRQSVPFDKIVSSVPPEHLAYILTGTQATSTPTVDQARKALEDAGMIVITPEALARMVRQG